MRRIVFAMIAIAAIAFGNLAAAGAAQIGDGSNMGPTPQPEYSVAGG
ncbi:MAG TPA: hypothetical protein VMU81_10900 [Acetobacteraceae bacterium]|nr:hypothetical protein [Acetobacteraceae bacterium]